MRSLATCVGLAVAIGWCAFASAGDLVLPVFGHSVRGVNGTLWSSEVYVTNPGSQPVQVSLSRFLPGDISRPEPCDLFAAPTKVVPPHSAVVWNANGLAVDLGCAERALGALVFHADGPVKVNSRLVNHEERDSRRQLGVLSGTGQEIDALSEERLPAAGSYLLPALLWHRNACGERQFQTSVGFANTGDEPVTVILDLAPETADGGIRIDNVIVDLPYSFQLPPGSWRQLRLEPEDLEVDICLHPESFVLFVDTGGPLAFYASVVDRLSQDPRTVTPVPVEK